MRWLAAAALPLLFAGCLGSPGSFLDASAVVDCSSQHASVVSARTDVLLPADVPDEARSAFGPIPRITVHAREGQTLTATAVYVPTSGEVDVLYDGPHSNQATTDMTWQSSGEVSEGDYTLELEGAPMAYGVTYTLFLVASGCTPAA